MTLLRNILAVQLLLLVALSTTAFAGENVFHEQLTYKGEEVAIIEDLNLQTELMANNYVDVPTMERQCKDRRGEEAKLGYANCTQAICWLGSGYTLFRPMENSTCSQNGRCFQGMCFQATLSFFRNLESRTCLQGTDRSSGTDKATLTECPTLSSPMNQFRTLHVNSGYWLTIRYSSEGKIGDKTKCLVAPSQEGGLVGFGPCTPGSRIEWDLVYSYYAEYLLIETSTGRCAKQEGDTVIAVDCGDRKDKSMIWRSDSITA